VDRKSLAAALGQPVASVESRPYPYRTTHHLDELDVELENGRRLRLLLKHLDRPPISSNAAGAKPEFLHNPLREIEAYMLLAPKGLGAPTLHASGQDWLLIDKIDGVELWQVGELSTWTDAARWLARLHRSFVGGVRPNRHLLRYDAGYFRIWPARALPFAPELGRIAERYGRVVEILATAPVTLVHGEFYASNIMIAAGRVAPVDWEMAGIGPGILDLAALASGWSEGEATAIVDAYGAVKAEELDAARVHIAMQWIGWSSEWTPPPEHARDWRIEAQRAAERLGI
jgi:hypothetical protein